MRKALLFLPAGSTLLAALTALALPGTRAELPSILESPRAAAVRHARSEPGRSVLGPPTAAGTRPPFNPLTAPPCPGVTVVAVTESEDTDWSSATVRAPGETQGRPRRFRSWVGRERVVYVGSHPRTGRPTVWLTSGSDLCRAELFGAPPAAATARRFRIRTETRAADERGAAIGAVLARIQRVGETEVYVERSAVDDVLANPARLLGSVRLDPSPRPGIGLLRVPAGSIPHALGLRSGDRLVGVNGLELRGMEDAMVAYARLRKAEVWQFEIRRHGRTRALRVEIR